MSNKWKKFNLAVIAVFGVLYLYAIINPEMRAQLGGTTTIVTTIIPIIYIIFFITKQSKTLVGENGQPINGTAKLGLYFMKGAMVVVAITLITGLILAIF